MSLSLRIAPQPRAAAVQKMDGVAPQRCFAAIDCTRFES